MRVFTLPESADSPIQASPLIELRYALSRGDVIAFNLHHAGTSATARRARRMAMWWIVIAMSFLIILSAYRDWRDYRNPIRAAIVAGPWLVLLILFLIVYPRLIRWAIRRNVQRIWSEGQNKAIVGDHVFKASESGMQNEGAYLSSRMSWELLERVEVAKDYVFVYISSFNALILPRSSFASAKQMVEFLQLIGRRAGVAVACPDCGYNLRGTEGGRCPECGFPRGKE